MRQSRIFLYQYKNEIMKVNKEENQPRSDLAEVVVRMRTKKSDNLYMRIGMEAKGHLIDWGDGVIDKRVRHYYEESGSYEICIRAKSINYLKLINCDLEELDVSGAKGLKYLICCLNHIKELNLTGLDEIESVDCCDNSLNSLILGEHLHLVRLVCSDNYLERLDLNGCKGLVQLYCNYNKLKNLSLWGCNNLRHIDCGNNCLDAEDLNGMIAMLPVVHYPEEAHVKIDGNPGSERKPENERYKLACLNHKGWNVDNE